VRIIVSASIIIAIILLFSLNASNKTVSPPRSPPAQQKPSPPPQQTSKVAYVKPPGWNFRSTPSAASSSNIIMEIPQNAQVLELEERRDGWSRIQYGNQIGYVKSESLSPTRVVVPSPPPKPVVPKELNKLEDPKLPPL
jgi:uncharacterized protein YgiM (DUF1202 family)